MTIPLFTVEGVTYRFETSTNLVDWSLISEVPRTNNLVEFNKIPSLTAITGIEWLTIASTVVLGGLLISGWWKKRLPKRQA